MSEIAYSIHHEFTIQRGCLVIELLELSKEAAIDSIVMYPSGLPADQWQQIAHTIVDREALAFLLKEDRTSKSIAGLKTSTSVFKTINYLQVRPSQVLALFKLLAVTQKVFFNKQKLIVDLYGQAEFYYEGVLQPTDGLMVEGKIRYKEQTLNLSQCLAIGPGIPFWYIHDTILRTIKTHLSWAKLFLLRQGPLSLHGDAKQKFLKDVDPTDLETPQIIWRSTDQVAIVERPTTFPILYLADRTGAFANLWIDYGNDVHVPLHDKQMKVKDGQGCQICQRQYDQESAWEKDLLETDFIKKIVDNTNYYCASERVISSLTFLLEIGWQIRDYKNRSVLLYGEMQLQLVDHKHTIDISGSVSYGEHIINVTQVMKAMHRGESFIPLTEELNNQAVGLVNRGNAEQMGLMELAMACDFEESKVRLKKSSFALLQTLWHKIESFDGLRDLANQWQNTFSTLALGDYFSGTLRPYQQQGLSWLNFLHKNGFHGILADEMGLGKTVQVLALIAQFVPNSSVHLLLVPTSLIFNWHNEIKRFLPSHKCKIHYGEERALSNVEFADVDIVITSYTTLRLDLPLFKDFQFTSIILDEAQIIKNSHTQIAQAVCHLSGKLRLCVTGTPLENRFQELWSYFHFLIPDLFGSLSDFEVAMQTALEDQAALESIKRKIKPFILRRRKIDVAPDLPERIDQMVWMEMGTEQRAFYEQFILNFKNGLLKKVQIDGISKHRLEILEVILRLRQICAHPVLLSEIMQGAIIPSSAKFTTLFEDLAEIVSEGHKVLVYSQFTSMLKLMRQEAEARQWPYSYLDGSTKNRAEAVDRFQNNQNTALFFISLKAGGVGLNLTAADYVYLYDPWWNVAVEEQAIQRAHRIGRENIVIAKRLVIRASIEEKIIALQASKLSLVESILDSQNLSLPLTELTIEDLHYLIS